MFNRRTFSKQLVVGSAACAMSGTWSAHSAHAVESKKANRLFIAEALTLGGKELAVAG